MAKGIHGIAYLIIGLVVAVVSYILNLKSDGSPFILFLGAGVVMVVIGIVKLTPKKSPAIHRCRYCGLELKTDYCPFCRVRI